MDVVLRRRRCAAGDHEPPVTSAGQLGPDSVRVGLRPPRTLFEGGAPRLRAVVERAEAAGIDQLCVGDHVTFQGGQGFDGLIQATTLAALWRTMGICTAVYLLPLRHPVPVARQSAFLTQVAPGRFTFGVGVGDDRHEVEACGFWVRRFLESGNVRAQTSPC